MSIFSQVFEALDEDQFEEYPVDVKTFVESPDYLGLPPLSDIQYHVVEVSSQIYYKPEVIKLKGVVEGEDYYRKYTKSEVILQLGKGCHIGTDEVYDPSTGRWSTIESLMDNPNTIVQGYDGANAVVQDGTEAWCEGMSEVFKVELEKGLSVTVSPDHKFYSENHEQVALKDLSVGDRITIAAKTECTNPQRIGDINSLIDKCDESHTIPSEVWSLPDDQLYEFLHAIVGYSNYAIDFTSVDKKDVQDLQRLLTRFGVLADLTTHLHYGRTLYRLKSSEYTGDVYYARIRSITKEVMPAPVYTMTAVDTKNFVANLVLNGNSGK